MSDLTDKKDSFTSAQEVYYNEVSRYVTDLIEWFKPVTEEDVPLVLEVIYLEWVERLENADES